MSNNDQEDSKENEETQHERTERSIRDLLVDQVRRLVPTRCNEQQPGTSATVSASQINAPKPQGSRAQNSEPNVTVLHVRASVHRTTPARPLDFSEQDSEMEITISPPPGPPKVISRPPPLAGAPPSYSAVMRLGPIDYPPVPTTNRRRGEIPIQPSPPFIAPAPPPSYAEAEGFYLEAEVASLDQIDFGTQPAALGCPNCGTFVMTTIRRRSSNLTHFAAFILCICGCWPCCLIPYCLDTCKVTYHHCPGCHQLLGIYTPWQ